MSDLGHTKEAVRLCEHIVRQAFGDVVCRVASTLLNKGRLALFSVHRLSGLRQDQVIQSLIILHQQNLILSNGASLLLPDSGTDELYEFNLPECLLRLRWPKILSVTDQLFGQIGVEVVRQVMLYGKLKVPDITASLLNSSQAGYDATQIEQLLIRLVREQFLQPTSQLLQVSRESRYAVRYAALEREHQKEKKDGKLGFTKNDLEELHNQTNSLINQAAAAERAIGRVLVKVEKPNAKRLKGDDKFDFSLNSTIPLRINYDRFGIVIRNELLVKAASDRWNVGAAEVLRAMLRVAHLDNSTLSDSASGPCISDAMSGFIPRDKQSILAAGIVTKSKSIVDIITAYLEVMTSSGGAGATPNAFLTNDDTGSSAYEIQYEAIAVKIRANLLLDMVRASLGGRAARVLATVAKAHHITEQQVRDCAMMPLKEARQLLADLQKMHLIETSEISKFPNAKRQQMTATSEHHLWKIDLAKAYSALLTSIYKTLGNILQRRASERAKRQGAIARAELVLRKSGRRDMLSVKDQEDLAELDDIMTKLALAEARCESTVFILRDLPGWPQSKPFTVD